MSPESLEDLSYHSLKFSARHIIKSFVGYPPAFRSSHSAPTDVEGAMFSHGCLDWKASYISTTVCFLPSSHKKIAYAIVYI